MKYTPKTEKEIAEENLWPAGEYDFEVTAGEDTQSEAGNDMIKLTVQIFNNEGRSRLVDDYLLESIAYKLRHACDACGLIETYETGELSGADFIQKTGRLKLGIQKDKTGAYPDKNVINDYIKRSVNGGTQESVSTGAMTANDLSDSIPF